MADRDHDRPRARLTGFEVRKLTGGRGVPLLLDLVGAAYLAENLAALAPRGRVVVGLMGGAQAAVDLGLLLSRRATVVGTVLRSRPIEEKAVLPMARARAAHERLERNESFGKLVLVP